MEHSKGTEVKRRVPLLRTNQGGVIYHYPRKHLHPLTIEGDISLEEAYHLGLYFTHNDPHKRHITEFMFRYLDRFSYMLLTRGFYGIYEDEQFIYANTLDNAFELSLDLDLQLRLAKQGFIYDVSRKRTHPERGKVRKTIGIASNLINRMSNHNSMATKYYHITSEDGSNVQDVEADTLCDVLYLYLHKNIISSSTFEHFPYKPAKILKLAMDWNIEGYKTKQNGNLEDGIDKPFF